MEIIMDPPSVPLAIIAIGLSLLLMPMMYVWPSLDKTPIQTLLSPPVLLSRSRQRYLKNCIRQRLDVYLRNTPQTWGSHILVRVTLPNGQIAASFYGTPSQLAEPVSRFLTTGLSTSISHGKSYSVSLSEGSFLRFSARWPVDPYRTSISPRTKSVSQVIPPRVDPTIPKRRSWVPVSSQQ